MHQVPVSKVAHLPVPLSGLFFSTALYLISNVYHNFNYTDMYVYEFSNDRYVLVNSSFSYSYKEDIIPIIVICSVIVIIVDVIIYKARCIYMLFNFISLCNQFIYT